MGGVLGGIGDESALYICKSRVTSEANRLFGPIGELNIEGQINEDSLDMISFFFTVKKELYKASCNYPEPYSKYNLVVNIEKED